MFLTLLKHPLNVKPSILFAEEYFVKAGKHKSQTPTLHKKKLTLFIVCKHGKLKHSSGDALERQSVIAPVPPKFISVNFGKSRQVKNGAQIQKLLAVDILVTHGVEKVFKNPLAKLISPSVVVLGKQTVVRHGSVEFEKVQD